MNIQKLQQVEQALHSYTIQRKSAQSQSNEVDTALRELSQSDESWKIIGNIMVKSDKDQLQEELKKRKQSLSSRLEKLEEQERKLQEQLEELKTEALGDGQ